MSCPYCSGSSLIDIAMRRSKTNLTELLLGLVPGNGAAIGNRALREAFQSAAVAAGENRKVAVKVVDDRSIESLKIVALD